jgi:trehalose 6-phosphate synthase/phosphatase
MRGNKIVEVMVSELDKGNAAKRLLNKKPWEFVLAMGDDTTDENLFAALPEHSYSIRIGTGATKARFNVMNQREALKILEKLAE